MSSKPNETPVWANLLGIAIVSLFYYAGGYDTVRDYIRSKWPHETLATVHYHGEWSVGEYRDCDSMNLKDYDKPDVVCADAYAPARLFKVRFVGSQVYDPRLSIGESLTWMCRRVDRDVTFSCVRKSMPEPEKPPATATPAPADEHELSKDDLENLRKRNECEQQFYDKKMYQVNGKSIGEACKQNPDLRP
jgi:hypothetical protein